MPNWYHALLITCYLLICYSESYTRKQFFKKKTSNTFCDKSKFLSTAKLNQIDKEMETETETETGINIDTFFLTPKLMQLVESLRDITDDKLRYQQLLFLGSKNINFDNELKNDQNKVPGCLSVVHIHAYMKDNKIYFQGDSDAILTRGLVQLLVDGLSGYSVEEIINVKPEFIQYTGIGASLTPGRNSGFLNMLNTMKTKARSITSYDNNNNNNIEDNNNIDDNNIKYNNSEMITMKAVIIRKLQQLDPILLELEDTSENHAGHVESQGLSSESHFELKIISNAFEGKSLVQRHKMIYTLLAAEMNSGIHALSIIAKLPSEGT